MVWFNHLQGDDYNTLCDSRVETKQRHVNNRNGRYFDVPMFGTNKKTDWNFWLTTQL